MRRYASALLRQTTRLLRHHTRDDRLCRRSGERGLAREHLVSNRAERVDIAAGCDRTLTHRLLGTHVARCAEGETGLRHARAARLGHGERDSEIRDDRTAIMQKNVLGL